MKYIDNHVARLELGLTPSEWITLCALLNYGTIHMDRLSVLLWPNQNSWPVDGSRNVAIFVYKINKKLNLGIKTRQRVLNGNLEALAALKLRVESIPFDVPDFLLFTDLEHDSFHVAVNSSGETYPGTKKPPLLFTSAFSCDSYLRRNKLNGKFIPRKVELKLL